MLRNVVLFWSSVLLFVLSTSALPTLSDDDFFNGIDFSQSQGPLDFSDLTTKDNEIAVLNSEYNATEAESKHLEKRDNIKILGYQIRIDGRKVGNVRDWVIDGSLFMTSRINSPGTNNGANAADFFLSVGNPAGAPMAGAIRYYTNKYLYRLSRSFDNSRLDFASVTKSGNTFKIVVDTRVSQVNELSAFNMNSGFLASIFLIDRGQINLTFSKDLKTVSGTIAVDGRGYWWSDQRGWYRGKISGRLVTAKQGNL